MMSTPRMSAPRAYELAAQFRAPRLDSVSTDATVYLDGSTRDREEVIAAFRRVYCSTTGFGQDGPHAQWAGHDLDYLAIGGFLGGMTGTRVGTFGSTFYAIYFDAIKLGKENYRATMTAILLTLSLALGARRKRLRKVDEPS